MGVGLVLWPALLPLLSDDGGGIDVIEIEPEFFWFETGNPLEPMRMDTGVLRQLADLPQRKLVHGVASPVGGGLAPDPQRMDLMRAVVTTLQAPWASEHLSFNAVPAPEGRVDAGFLLPPLQTVEGAEQAAANIRAMADGLRIPVAVENNVNYLRPCPGELTDGDFLAEVAQRADCGLLLDLHNLWVNEQNGRQPARAALERLPLERVWEVHLAGGTRHRGYWLDAHSGPVADEVMALAAETIPALPNLRALIFEMLPAYLPQVGMGKVRRQIERLHGLWALRRPGPPRPPRQAVAVAVDAGAGLPRQGRAPSSAEWEQALGASVSGLPHARGRLPALEDDPGVDILRELALNARAGQIASAARLTTRVLLAHGGGDAFQAMFAGYAASHPPRQFASSEALAFLDHARSQPHAIRYLEDVAAFESAVIRSALGRDAHRVDFHVDPLPLLAALSEGRAVPDLPASGPYRIQVESGAVTALTHAGARRRRRHRPSQ
nr:DUF692 domain-containing protein [Luteimonas salinisoli]